MICKRHRLTIEPSRLSRHYPPTATRTSDRQAASRPREPARYGLQRNQPNTIGTTMRAARSTLDKIRPLHSAGGVPIVRKRNKGPTPLVVVGCFEDRRSSEGSWAIKSFRSKGSGVAISGNPFNSARMGGCPSYSRSTPQVPAFQTTRRKPDYDRRAFAGLLRCGNCLKGLNWARASRPKHRDRRRRRRH